MKKTILGIMFLNVTISIVSITQQKEIFLAHWIMPLGMMVVLIVSSLKTKKENEALLNIQSFAQMTILIVQLMFIMKGKQIQMEEEVFVAVIGGFALYIMGIFMQETKRNMWFGLRMPWIYKNEEIWGKSNQFAGLLMIASSPIIIFLSILFVQEVEVVIGSVLLPIVLISIIYSYIIYRKEVKKIKNKKETM